MLSEVLLVFFFETDRETHDVNQEDYRRLPDCLTESLNALEEDALFNDMMGENLVVCLKAIRKVRFKLCFLPYTKVSMFDRIPLSAEELVTLEKVYRV